MHEPVAVACARAGSTLAVPLGVVALLAIQVWWIPIVVWTLGVQLGICVGAWRTLHDSELTRSGDSNRGTKGTERW